MKRIPIVAFLLLICIIPCAVGQEADLQPPQPTAEPEVAGEMFGMPVSKDNYYFALNVVIRFSSPWGAIPNNQQELEDRIWDELLLSYESFRRNITVERSEIETEVDKTLKGHKVTFDWKTDKDAYEKWAKETLGGSTLLFENQMQHLIQLRKLLEEVKNSIEPTVTEEEAFQEFQNEYNTLSVELVQFDKLEDAQGLYAKATGDPNFWENEKKIEEEQLKKEEATTGQKQRSKFKRPGFVALEFLMHMWKFQKDDVYKMIDQEIGTYYPPSPIYKGYGVFKILEVRKAKPDEFPQRRESYFDQIREQKKWSGFYDWLWNLRQSANIKRFIKPPKGIFNEAAQQQ